MQNGSTLSSDFEAKKLFQLQTHVRDGDTIEVEGVAVRLRSLDCAESGTLKGNQATLEMDRIVLGETISCEFNGRPSYDRLIGECLPPNNSGYVDSQWQLNDWLYVSFVRIAVTDTVCSE